MDPKTSGRPLEMTVTRYEDHKNKWLDFIAFIPSVCLLEECGFKVKVAQINIVLIYLNSGSICTYIHIILLYKQRGSAIGQVPFTSSHATFYLSPLTADSNQSQPITAELPACHDRFVGEGNGCILTWLFEKCQPSQCEALMSLSTPRVSMRTAPTVSQYGLIPLSLTCYHSLDPLLFLFETDMHFNFLCLNKYS